MPRNGDIESWYDREAAAWSTHYGGGDKRFVQRLRNVHKLIGNVNVREFADIGCGTGEITESIAEKYDALGHGFDLSQRMVEKCRNRYDGRRVTFDIGNICAIKMRDNSCDLITSVSVIEWVEDVDRATKEVARVLRPHGRWVVSMPNWRSPFRWVEAWRNRMLNTGYTKYQKNRIRQRELEVLAESHGLRLTETLYQVVPGYAGNIGGPVGRIFGMMCFMAFDKVCAYRRSIPSGMREQ